MTQRRYTEALASADPEERRRAAAALRDLPPEETASHLLKVLGDEDWRVRKEGVGVATALAPNSNLLETLIDAFEPSDNVGLRNAAVEAIAAFGADAVDALASALGRLDADGRKLAAEALSRTGVPQAILVLRGMLRDTDPNVRVAAVESIALLGAADPKNAASVLESVLDSSDHLQRLAALDGLSSLGVLLAFDRLERLRSDPVLEPAVFAAAGRSGDVRAASMLVQGLNRARGGTRNTIVRAMVELARTGPDRVLALRAAAPALDSAAREALLLLATREDGEERLTALLAAAALALPEASRLAISALEDELLEGAAEEALDFIGPEAVEPLLDHARDIEPALRALCLEIAARLADESRSALVARVAKIALTEPPEVVRSALTALSLVGDPGALADVAACLIREGAGTLRRAAESSLAVLGARFPDAALELAGAAGVGDAHAVAVLVRVVGTPARGSHAADVEYLSAALSSSSPHVRRAALGALAEVGGEPAVEPISIALADEEPDVRLSAVRALGRVRTPEGESLGLAELMRVVDRASEPRMVAAALLALGATRDARALPVLRPHVRSGNPTEAVAAIEALGAFPEPRRLEALIDGLSHSASEVVKAALLSLGESSDPRVLLHLGAALDHEAWDVRRLAADLLARYGGAAAAPLRSRLAVEEDQLVREAIGRALERVAGVRKSTPPTRGSYWPR